MAAVKSCGIRTRRFSRHVTATVVVLALVGSACGAPSSTTTQPSATTTVQPSPTTTTTEAPSTTTVRPSPTATTEAPPTTPTEAPATTASDAAFAGLLTDQIVEVSGWSRSYHLFVPAQAEGAPLVVLLHGYGFDPDMLLGLDGEAAPFGVWLDIAEREGFAVAVPRGVGLGWNDCRRNVRNNPAVDDVEFLGALIDEVAAIHRIDASRVFVTGLSNGGHMSIRLAEESPDRIAGFAAIAAADASLSECASTENAVAALFMNGSADKAMPFGGGVMGNGAEVFSSDETVGRWVKRNGAAEATVETVADVDPDDRSTVTISRYPGEPGGAPVVFYAIVGGGHNEPSLTEELVDLPLWRTPQNRDIEMAEEVWRFFSELDS